jgi:predicted RNase H-like nuclease
VRQVDDVMTPELESRVIESHPEVSFAAMADAVLPPKKSAPGVAGRIAALAPWIDATAALATAPATVPVDDALDALACAWTAERFVRGIHESLGDGTRDDRGLVMRIVL